MPDETKGGIRIVLTTPRVAPGLLTRAAWQALGEADEIGASGAPDRPDVQAVIGSGLVVTQVQAGGQSLDAVAWTWLSTAAAAGRRVVWLAGEDGDPGLLRLVADQLTREPQLSYEVEILHGSYDVPGARLIDLVRVMDRLRRNCPWDQQQTHESLAKYLLEETYETLEAIDTGDRAHLREELGDILLQVAFHSRIAEEATPDLESDEEADQPWSIDDVAGDIVEKLIRRHPHVFGTVDAADAAAVEANWETIKAAEKQRTSVLEGIPLALPALALADKVLGRAAKLLPTDPTPPEPTDDTDRIGRQLLAVVREARTLGIDPEQALRATIQQLTAEIRQAESGR